MQLLPQPLPSRTDRRLMTSQQQQQPLSSLTICCCCCRFLRTPSSSPVVEFPLWLLVATFLVHDKSQTKTTDIQNNEPATAAVAVDIHTRRERERESTTVDWNTRRCCLASSLCTSGCHGHTASARASVKPFRCRWTLQLYQPTSAAVKPAAAAAAVPFPSQRYIQPERSRA